MDNPACNCKFQRTCDEGFGSGIGVVDADEEDVVPGASVFLSVDEGMLKGDRRNNDEEMMQTARHVISTSHYRPLQGWGGSEIHDLSSLQILPNLGTGTELSSNFSETSLIGTERKELKFQQILGEQGTEELGSLTFQRNFPVPDYCT